MTNIVIVVIRNEIELQVDVVLKIIIIFLNLKDLNYR